MSSEVKRYEQTDLKSEWQSSLSPNYQPPFEIWLEFRVHEARQERQSERLSHEETTKQLRALEDAIESCAEEDEGGDFYIDGGWIISENPINANMKKLYQAIQNSRARKQV